MTGQEELRRASARLRHDITRPSWPGNLLIECSGLEPGELPVDDVELWLQLAAGVVMHQGGLGEVATGEGKTLVAAMPSFLNALVGQGMKETRGRANPEALRRLLEERLGIGGE